MAKVEIMALCRDAEILKVMERLINNNPDWQATCFNNIADALDHVDQQGTRLVLLGSGFEGEEEERLTTAIAVAYPHVSVIKHYGGGSGLLYGEIYQGLNT